MAELKPRTSRELTIARLAKAQLEKDGECEFEAEPVISEGVDNGAYVQAWVWVNFGGTELDKDKKDA